MTNSKMTQEKALMFALGLDEIQSNKEVVDKFNDMLIAIRKKRDNKTASKTQIENETFKVEILDLMEINSLYTCTQIVKMLNDERVQSPQKVVALFKSLEEEGKVVKVKDKKSTFYKKVA